MSDISGDGSPAGTYKTVLSLNGSSDKPEMFNLLPVKKEEDDNEDLRPPEPKQPDSNVPEGMAARNMSHDRALENLANIPIHQVM